MHSYHCKDVYSQMETWMNEWLMETGFLKHNGKSLRPDLCKADWKCTEWTVKAHQSVLVWMFVFWINLRSKMCNSVTVALISLLESNVMFLKTFDKDVKIH